MLTRRSAIGTLVLVIGGARGTVHAAKKKAASGPKYYFAIAAVEGGQVAGANLEEDARRLLTAELAGRPEFTSELQANPSDQAAVVSELARRKLQGFRVTLRFDRLKAEPLPPKEGGRLKRIGVDMKLSVFGTTLPGEKLAFGGDGEAMSEAEVLERKMDEETKSLLNDVMAQAIRQAVDQAVLKLSLPKSAPINESQKRRKK